MWAVWRVRPFRADAGGWEPRSGLGGERAGQGGHELVAVHRAPAAGQVVAGPGLVPGDVAEGVSAGGDVEDAGVQRVALEPAAGAQRVERVAEVAERVAGHLAGQRDDAREERGGLTGAAEDLPARAARLEALVDPGPAADRGRHRDVGGAAAAADHAAHTVLPGGLGADR